MKKLIVLTTALGIAAFGMIAIPAHARTIFDDIRDTAPRTIFDDIRDTAPRTIFDDIRDTAPVRAAAPNDGALAGE